MSKSLVRPAESEAQQLYLWEFNQELAKLFLELWYQCRLFSNIEKHFKSLDLPEENTTLNKDWKDLLIRMVERDFLTEYESNSEIASLLNKIGNITLVQESLEDGYAYSSESKNIHRVFYFENWNLYLKFEGTTSYSSFNGHRSYCDSVKQVKPQFVLEYVYV